MLKKYPALKLEISGHTSDDGTRERNMKLSQERAESAKAYLVRRHRRQRITTVGYGPDKPLVTTRAGAGEEPRIEFRLVGQDEARAGAPSLPRRCRARPGAAR